MAIAQDALTGNWNMTLAYAILASSPDTQSAAETKQLQVLQNSPHHSMWPQQSRFQRLVCILV